MPLGDGREMADERCASRSGRDHTPEPPFAPRLRPIPADNRILYFERDRELFGFLSHFQPAPILLDGEPWPTVERWYQAQKSDDPAYRAAIRAAAAPGMAKRVAALGAAADLGAILVPPDRHPAARRLGRGEAGPWGSGRDGAGLNWAGRVLMEVRQSLHAVP
jgi:hypothetical protein